MGRRSVVNHCDDGAVGTRFDTLTDLLGERFLRVEFDGPGHSTVTEHRQQAGVERVLEFFTEKLKPAPQL